MNLFVILVELKFFPPFGPGPFYVTSQKKKKRVRKEDKGLGPGVKEVTLRVLQCQSFLYFNLLTVRTHLPL